MRALTKKHRTNDTLISLNFRVHPRNVERIRSYVAKIEPAVNDSIGIDEFYTKHFGDQPQASVSLRGLRYREDMTQRQLAEATGIPQRHISEMETGKRPIGKEVAKRFADVLHADYRTFL